MKRMRQTDGVRRSVFWAGLVGLIAVAAMALPASASAALCPVTPGVEVTAWTGGSGDFGNDLNWSNGTPSGSCDAVITPAGNPTISMTGGASMRSLILGGVGSTPTLVISAQSPNTILHATTSGIDIAPGASIVLTCAPQPTGCLGGAGGGSALNVGSSSIDNQGTIAVDANSGTGASIAGAIDNTGTIDIDQEARHNSGLLRNRGVVDIADGKVFISATESCGSTGTVFWNDEGGTLTANGSGGLSAINFEQGDGDTLGTNPVRIPCGTLKYTGDGPSTVRATGGFALSGEMQTGQSLTVSDESSNTSATLTGNFTSKGSITLTCPSTGACGADLNAAGNVFTNAGTLTVPATGGASTEVNSGGGGSIVNTGTMNFEQNAFLGGVIVNKGPFNVADGITVTNSGSSCGDTGAQVKNDTGGQINATGSGRLNVLNYEQGNGTTNGTAPVQIPCGSLKYTGNGASTVQLNGGVGMTGNIAAGQTLRIVNGGSNVPPFTNAGTIVFDPSGSGPHLNVGTLTNTGRIAGVGTVNGALDNTTGTVAPGVGPTALTVNNGYTQGAGGTLEIDVEGTTPGEFGKLAVGGNVTLGGTLALVPSAAYAKAAAVGDSVAFLTYGGSRTAVFAQTTANPALPCPKLFGAAYNDGPKNVSAVVSDKGSCPSPPLPPDDPPSPNPSANPSVIAPVVVPDTVLGSHPKKPVKTSKAKATVKFSFSSDQPGATFQCKLDKETYKPCASPTTYKLKPGKHKIAIQAVLSGNVDPTPASFEVKVVKKKKKKK